MEFVLVGQPNCGKSTIFNDVGGYKSVASNFPGVTVEYTRSRLNVCNHDVDIVDLPGTYSLHTSDEAEVEAVKYLLNPGKDAVIVNIVDASVLSRSLELTLQLIELQQPMVVALNMMDEAVKKGINVDTDKLSEILGVPVIAAVGRKGTGIGELFRAAFREGRSKRKPQIVKGNPKEEAIISDFETLVEESAVKSKWSSRFMAIKLLEGDTAAIDCFEGVSASKKKFDDFTGNLKEQEGVESDLLISSLRHNLAFEIFEKTAEVSKPEKLDIRERIDSVLMHPFLGVIFLGAILFLLFKGIFLFAESTEPFIGSFFEYISGWGIFRLGEGTLGSALFKGFVDGIGGGIGIALPYLLPFFVLLAILEDTGYLARIAYLIDNFMHKIGLHGLSVVPMILGYGCSVPAVMATRILKSSRDRFITAILTTLVPCSARMVVILGLVGAVFGLKEAILVYVLNIVVISITGKVMSKLMPEVSPGLIMEIPRYHLPGVKAVLNKTWFRMREFVYTALPLLIVGSIVLEAIEHFNLTAGINDILAPFTEGLLGLPVATGVVLLFGIMRKELALLLLTTAMGIKSSADIASVMTSAQIYGFTVFATFYVPCIATIAALIKEFNTKKAMYITLFTFGLAIVLAVICRVVF